MRTSWFRALNKIGYRRLFVFETRLARTPSRMQPKVKAAIRRLRAEDKSDFTVLFPGKTALFRQRLTRGRQCWGAWCDGSLRQVIWTATGEAEIDYLGCRLVLSRQEFYTFEAWTHPAWRRLGLHQATKTTCYQAFFDKGFRRGLAAVLPENRPSIAALNQLGSRKIGRLVSIGWGRWRRCFYRPEAGSHRPVTVIR